MKGIVDYKELTSKIIGTSIPRPVLDSLSGHVAGEPFDKYVYKKLKEVFPNKTFRQYEYLNDLFRKNPKIISAEERFQLFNSPSVMFLLSRSKSATQKWSVYNLFEEKQNDTADILVVDGGFYEIIDIKTRNISKSAQPPNIISSFKLAQLCATMIDNEEFDNLSINYFEIDWELENNSLVCKDAHHIRLFNSTPENLYINWAAAMQIQFHVCDLKEDFTGTVQEWAIAYLKHYVTQVYRRSRYMIDKYAKPFEKYVQK